MAGGGIAMPTTVPEGATSHGTQADPAGPSTRHRNEIQWTAVGVAVIAVYAAAALVFVPEGTSGLATRIAVLAAVVGVGFGLGALAGRNATVRAVLLLAVGFAAIAVTAGVVVGRVRFGLTVRDVLGIAAGVAGVGLVVAGWRLLLRDVRRRWLRILVASIGTLLVAQFLLLPAVLAFHATNGARPQASGRTPADLGLAYRDVRITASDGTRLAAWWIPSRNGAVVVVLPGSGSTRDDELDRAALLAHAGYGVLVPDARGHGASEGRIMEFGWGADRDVRAAVSYALAQPGVTGRIGIVGQSMGGEVAVTTAAGAPRVAALVVEGVGARTWADARSRPDAHPVSLANEWLLFGLVGLLTSAPEPTPLVDAFAAVAPRPVLLISGAPATEATLGALYADTSPGTVTWWALPDTPHTGALSHHRAEYAERVIGFLDEHLLGS
jgi:pimeloyl-ACP methyl ester carboxylesterase